MSIQKESSAGIMYCCGDRSKAAAFFVLVAVAALLCCVGRARGAQAEEAGDLPEVPEPIELDLAEAKKRALLDNPGLKAASARIVAASEILAQVRSTYFPRVTLSVSARHNEEIPHSMLWGPVDPYDSYAAGVTLSWRLFDGLATRSRVLASGFGEDASMEARRDARRLLLQAVSRAFYNSLLAREGVRIADQDAEFNRELSSETRKRFEAGAATRSDVLNFEIRTAEAESRSLSAELDLEVAKNVLVELLGIRNADMAARITPAPIPVELPPPVSRDIVSELEFAFEHRGDVRELVSRFAQLKARCRVQKADYWPTVSLEAYYGVDRYYDMRFDRDLDDVSFVGVTAAWPLFSGGSSIHSGRQLAAEAEEVWHQLQAKRIAVAAELQTARDAEETARSQLALRQRIHSMTEEARDLVRKEYLAGKASLTRLNEAQTDLIRALGTFVRARINLYQALENLAAASGRNFTLGVGEQKTND